MGEPVPTEDIGNVERGELSGSVVTVVQHRDDDGTVRYEAFEGRLPPEVTYPHCQVLQPGEAVRVSSNEEDWVSKWCVAVRIVENRDGEIIKYADNLKNRNKLQGRGVTVLEPLL